MVRHALVDDADQVGAGSIVELHAEVALGVGLSAARLFHPLAQTEKDDVIASGGFVGGAVRDLAGESLGRGGNEKERTQEYEKKPPLLAKCARNGAPGFLPTIH